ncbi:MAG: hypothetical protein CME06_15115 [Gemmatimonadetes bacterium]|nr:hypothetical protein [Gemmatimonadota bacterium]
MTGDIPQEEAWRGDRHRDDGSWRGDLHPERPRDAESPLPEAPIPRLETVYRASSPAIADLIRGLLDDHQIPHIRLADSATGIFGVPQHLDIAVPEGFGEEALALIREFVDERAGVPSTRSSAHAAGRGLLLPVGVALAAVLAAIAAAFLLD